MRLEADPVSPPNRCSDEVLLVQRLSWRPPLEPFQASIDSSILQIPKLQAQGRCGS